MGAPTIQAVAFIGPRNNPLWIGTRSASSASAVTGAAAPAAGGHASSSSTSGLDVAVGPNAVPTPEELRIHHILHSALDVIEERTLPPTAPGHSSRLAGAATGLGAGGAAGGGGGGAGAGGVGTSTAATALSAGVVAPGSMANQNYLGLLTNVEDLSLYAWQTSLRMRIVLALSANHRALVGREGVVRDIDVITIFRALQTLYLGYISNPFHALDFTPRYAAEAGRTKGGGGGDDVDGGSRGADATAAYIFEDELGLPLGKRPIRSERFVRSVRDVLGWSEAVG